MPIRLPRLTLFSGPQCSLCDVAKAELRTLRKEHNFELTTIDIQSPGQERWKRRYVYWIPALHLDDVEIAKGRWDASTERTARSRNMEVIEGGEASTGGHELKHLDIQDSEILGDDLFFFDASAMTAWPAQTIQYTTESTSALGISSQDDSLADDEPPYDPDAEYVQPNAKQCFNCMATTHIVSDCPHKRDPQHVALARADYGSRGGNTTRSVRLHEAAEGYKRRVEFARTFEPGYVQGGLLRESLDLSEIYGGGNEDLPWHYTMCDWGYPPGWVSDIDPRNKIMERIDSTSKYEPNENFPSLSIFDDEDSDTQVVSMDNLDTSSNIPLAERENLPRLPPSPRISSLDPSPPDSILPPPPDDFPPPPPDDIPAPPPDFPPPPPDEPPPAAPPPPDALPFPPRRWAHYRTTLFQSERLPISLITRPLPALSEAPPPPPSGLPPPPPPAPPPQPPKELTEQEKRRLLWEQIVAANS